jgi:hypothetical protein
MINRRKSQCLGSSHFQLNCHVSHISRRAVNTDSVDGMVQIAHANQSIQAYNKEG